MSSVHRPLALALALSVLAGPLAGPLPALAAQGSRNSSQANTNTGAVNSVEVPKQILRSGVNLTTTAISPNSRQLADQIGLTDSLQRIQSLRALISQSSPASVEDRLALQEALEEARSKLMQTAFEVDFVCSEIQAEQNIYQEVLSTFTANRDKLVARTNALSFITNGILWAVSCGLAIPTYKYPGYSVQSGITGIVAGIVPSAASLYAMKVYSGAHKTSELDPNMLAPIFDYPVDPEIAYPASVWTFIESSPALEPNSLSRRKQLVKRWIEDSNIPGFTDANSKKQLDAITASAAQRKGLSIDTLNARLVMLEQLESEILKMKRLLLDLSLAISGAKKI